MKKAIKICLISGVICLVLGSSIALTALAMGAERSFNYSFGFNRWDDRGDWPDEGAWSEEDSFDNISELDADLAAGEIIYEVGGVDEITLLAEKNDRYSWKVEGNTLKIDSYQRRAVNDRGRLVIQVPDGFVWDEFDLEMAAGSFYAKTLSAKDAKIDLKAGSVVIDGGIIGYLDGEMAAGSMTCRAVVEHEAELDCSAGELNVWMRGPDTDYNTEIECNLGTVSVGDYSIAGLIGKKELNKKAEKELSVHCNTGAVHVFFVD